ncbi:hypothetical protein GQR58_026702 [Nymphon striatum]|nr:hypothetical protein GQR58_026702 [Nymphon striatum]
MHLGTSRSSRVSRYDLKEWTKSKNLGEVKRKAENKVVFAAVTYDKDLLKVLVQPDRPFVVDGHLVAIIGTKDKNSTLLRFGPYSQGLLLYGSSVANLVHLNSIIATSGRLPAKMACQVVPHFEISFLIVYSANPVSLVHIGEM